MQWLIMDCLWIVQQTGTNFFCVYVSRHDIVLHLQTTYPESQGATPSIVENVHKNARLSLSTNTNS
jgi:hypothetical protein